MKTKIFSAAVLSTFLFAFAGCGGDTHESVMEDMAGELGAVADILATATDKASAEAAAKKLDAIAPRLEAIAKRAQELEPPTPAEAMALMNSMGAYQETMMKFAKAQVALAQNPEAMAALQGAMTRFQNAMKSSPTFGK